MNEGPTTTCPRCGADLLESGVIELRGYLRRLDDSGFLDWESGRTELDDAEGYLCAGCSHRLDAEVRRVGGRDGVVMRGSAFEEAPAPPAPRRRRLA